MSNIDGRLEGLKSATIMMVDDEPTTIDVLETFLEGEGYTNFVTTTDSRQTLDLVAAEKPDVLILNLVMPHVGGLEILGAIRKDEALKDTPVIILTSCTDPATKLQALKLGATDFLGKPVDPSELALRLRNTLAVRASADRLGSARQREKPAPDEAARSGPAVVSRLGAIPRFRPIIEKFTSRLELKLEAMESSWEAGDFEELVKLAHWLKGAAGTVGFDAFTAPAEALKLHAIGRKENEIEASLRELRRLSERIVVASDGAAMGTRES